MLLIGNKACPHHLMRGFFLVVTDCYITIQSDKTISRLHANLITEEAKAPKLEINDVADISQMTLKIWNLIIIIVHTITASYKYKINFMSHIGIQLIPLKQCRK
jgi:hypothetical protein